MYYIRVNIFLFHQHLLERLSLLHCIAFAPLSKINWLCLCRSISSSLFCFRELFVYSFTNIILSWSLQLYSKFWSQVVSVSPLTCFSLLKSLFLVAPVPLQLLYFSGFMLVYFLILPALMKPVLTTLWVTSLSLFI